MFQSVAYFADQDVHGIIGPANSEVAERIAPIASRKLDLPQVTLVIIYLGILVCACMEWIGVDG